ncbi:MAG: glycosyltransferase family 8 protein [Sulfurovaceae bacterium]|nr:glycosyltransferase family 8 protein [Sulfurovaceae bacterium]
MNKEIINVVLASDDNYAQPMGTAIYSMLDNFSSEEQELAITILDGGISDESKEKLFAICRTFDTKIDFKRISKDDFRYFPLLQYFSLVAYFRLLIPRILDTSVEKAVYIDCDIMVLGNMAELFNTDIGNNYVGAIRDHVEEQVFKMDCPFYKDIKKYFNSGILVMNLTKMREENFIEKCFEFNKEHSKEILYADQDILNYICIDNWTELDKAWNTQLDRSEGKITPTPKIIHYTTSFKPWYRFYHNYYQKYYMGYLKKAWPNYTIKPVPFKTIIKQLIKYIPFSVAVTRLIKRNLNILS